MKVAKGVIAVLLLLTGAAQAQIPEWAKGAVWYQIFPERFRNGSPANDPIRAEVVGNAGFPWQVHPWTSDWYRLQPWEQARDGGFYDVVFERRYGGDLLGVIEKLDYLQELGVDVLYFNPIFEAASLHKYDATTYHHIDNNFGPDARGDWPAILNEREDPATWTWTAADKTFLELIAQAHARGIKIVIDGVFNHSGTAFWAMRDVIEKQQQSRYRDWYDVTAWDDPATPDTNEFNFKGWWGYKSLPEFKEDENGFVSPTLKKYFFDVTRRWMDPNGDGNPADGIDGWRLDVAPDVSPKFWQEWYRVVKSINPQAFTLGEIWDEQPEAITEKRFDALMNYPVAKLMYRWFINRKQKIAVSEFDRELARIRALYPAETNHVMMNLIDSHDTDRVASMIRNPDRTYNQQENNRVNPKYDPRKPDARGLRTQEFLAIFQLTYPGAPSIYYGDEAGMWGGKDPDCRKPMLWPDLQYEPETYTTVRPDLKDADPVRFNQDLFQHYKKLVHLRKSTPALRHGDFRTLLADDARNLYAYARKAGQSLAVVVLNNQPREQAMTLHIVLPEGATLVDELNGGRVKVRRQQANFQVPAKWGRIFVRQ